MLRHFLPYVIARYKWRDDAAYIVYQLNGKHCSYCEMMLPGSWET